MSTTETGAATTGQRAGAPATLCEAFAATVARCPDGPAIRTREGDHGNSRLMSSQAEKSRR
jgi:hypothetical protein